MFENPKCTSIKKTAVDFSKISVVRQFSIRCVFCHIKNMNANANKKLKLASQPKLNKICPGIKLHARHMACSLAKGQ